MPQQWTSRVKKLATLPASSTSSSSRLPKISAAQEALHPIEKMKQGFETFKETNLLTRPHVHEPLKSGQTPKVMVISCSDSRVCPTQVFGLDAGEAFVVRSVANLIPPFGEEGFPGTSAALEYGVLHLKVEHIFVVGHSMCGGIKALMSIPDDAPKSTLFIEDWIKIGKPARNAVLSRFASSPLDQQCRHCEKEAVNMSLSNLMSFPFIKDMVSKGKLSLHGGYYDFVDGKLEEWVYDKVESKAMA